MSQIPPEITPEMFRKWRSPRRGTGNPSLLSNDVWKWIVEQRDEEGDYLNAYRVDQSFNGPGSFKAGPCWCFDRFGRTITELPDGRTLYIAGEHEDYYDPDFYIYNDLLVVERSGEPSFFGYPVEVFPPTDFHTCTLCGDSLILLGNLGYSDKRRPGQTQVLRMELDSWQVSGIETAGNCPGWIHKHNAALSEDGTAILITGGSIYNSDGIFENIDDWSLCVKSWQWTRVRHHNWKRFMFFRKDRKPNHLFNIFMYGFHKQMEDGELLDSVKKIFDTEKILKKELGAVPDLQIFDSLYIPPTAKEIVGEDEGNYRIHRIRIDDVVVRYVDDGYAITMTVEGDLPDSEIAGLKDDLMKKFSALERKKIVCEEIVSR